MSKYKFFMRNFTFFICLITSLVFVESEIHCREVPDNREGDVIRLSLLEAIEMALAKNRNLQSSAFSVKSQEVSLGAVESDFDIKISPMGEAGVSSSRGQDSSWSVGGEVSKRFTTGIKVGLSPSLGRGEEDFNAGLNLKVEVPLMRGWGEEKSLDPVYSSRYGVSEARYSYQLSQVNLVLETVQAVYDLAGSREEARIIGEQLVPLKEQLLVTEVKERAGVADRMDLYRSQLQIKGVQGNLSTVREQVKNGEDRLKRILALPMEKKLLIEVPIDYEEVEIDLDLFISTAFENRIEIRRKKEALAEQKRKNRLAEHNLQPDLRLKAGYDRLGYSDTFGDSFRFNEELWTVRLSSSTDLARSSEHAAYEQSRLAVRQEELSLEGLREQIVQEIRSRINGLQKAGEQIRINEGRVIDSTGKLRLADVKFRFGEANNFDLTQARSELQ
ncbi:MAG: TolC family protein, partial [Thermodesulfobacteriota bacterium]